MEQVSTIRYAARTDLGMRRNHNEDGFGILENDGLVLVADGMGGHAAGEIASEIAINEVASFYHQALTNEQLHWPYEQTQALNQVENRLVCGLALANLRIFEASGARGRKGMGTTLVAAAIVGDAITIAHVGDSRAYRIRRGAITRLTRDHSLLEQFKEINPGMTREEEQNFPHKNVITRALGLNDAVEIDVRTYDLEEDDRYLLCSDGLSGHLDDDELLELLSDSRDMETVATDLVERANAAGGNDNITVVVMRRY
jgi:serine/threonine protein phosphatase PrpC